MDMNYLLRQYGGEKVGCVPWNCVEHHLKSYGMTLSSEMDERELCRLGNTIDESLAEKLHISAEVDPACCQIVPYVVIEDVSTGEYLVTRRRIPGSQHLDAFSVGIASHVWKGEDIVAAKERIITELAGLSAEDVYMEDVGGFIMDRSSVIGRTHLGIVLRLEIVDKESVNLHELLEGAWKSPAKLATLYKNGRFEAWSELVFESEILETLQNSRVAYASMIEAAAQLDEESRTLIAIGI